MDELINEFFTLTGMIIFFSGVGSACLWHVIKQRYIKHREPADLRIVGIIAGVAALVFIGMQNTQLASEVRDCQREFNHALRARAQISAENDEVSQTQRRIVFDWIHNLIFPPPPFDVMSTDDPRRQDYGLTITIQTEKLFRTSLAKQDELQAERDRRPLPDPTCGK